MFFALSWKTYGFNYMAIKSYIDNLEKRDKPNVAIGLQPPHFFKALGVTYS